MASVKDKLKKGGQEITLMTVLANEATGSSRKILKEYGMPDAKNYQDLEIKLAELYFNTKDKVALERKLAEIHPHKEFMKKYLLPTPPPKAELVVEEITETTSTPEITKMPELVSNCNGSCDCKKENFSGADGLAPITTNDKDKLIIYGMFGIISILALVLISKQK